ncbi:Mysoin-binding motif of peroxisomes-domain-containing protein [Cokeromyces recurvatus]|uniref:Mysoin-binding motif of peroxisomes-domain-containing protein n=1 Tax=Cokeromyces recurvatus TaxID=90255 RepID=UPI00221E84A0|nr:Mysoin-binding motif of peroxisomes-domain-containing protein [Cokeromyces recurvatus]KAI7904984.1 Mysoin-binding motif of peroxisomes-domain-containing protein [Cokeromyces recurvatus]
MTEFIVYEDSPFAEYLQSIDQAEATIKVEKPTLSINTTQLKERPSMLRMWRHSMLHGSFSISLPRTEESAFEEKFKYLIVTSPLLSETLSVHHHHHHHYNNNNNNSKQKKQQQQQFPELPFQATPTTTVMSSTTTTQLIASLAILFGIERYFLRPQKLPIITFLFSTSTSLFFYYRHRQRKSIRELYQVALDRVQSFMDHSDQLDTKMHRAFITIQEIELVSRGYRLSKPYSPISRIEQMKSSKKKCQRLRQRLASILRRAFIIYEEAIIDLMSVVHKKNVNTLYDMYNVHSIASLSAVNNDNDDDDNSLEQLKKLAQIMHLKRRECMVHLLALENMSTTTTTATATTTVTATATATNTTATNTTNTTTNTTNTEGHDGNSFLIRLDYQQGWKIVNDVLKKMLCETEQCIKDIIEALDAEFYRNTNTSTATTTEVNSDHQIQDKRLKKFVHKLSSLEQQLRTLEAKIYLCNEHVRQFNSETKENLYHEYMSIQKEFEFVTSEWESGRIILESFLSPTKKVDTTTIDTQREQGEEEEEDKEETKEGKGIVLDAEDVADILNLPLASKASVYEAVAGVVEKNGKEKSKKKREERIEEMRLRRAREAEEKAAQLDSQNMVYELKNVLYKRVTDLDLNTEEDRK